MYPGNFTQPIRVWNNLNKVYNTHAKTCTVASFNKTCTYTLPLFFLLTFKKVGKTWKGNLFLDHTLLLFCALKKKQLSKLSLNRQWREQGSRLKGRKKLWLLVRWIKKKKSLALFACHYLLCICTQNWQVTHFPSFAAAGSESQVSIAASSSMDHEEFNSDLKALSRCRDETPEAAESPPLSVRQLVLRRGLIMLFMMSVLGAGIVINKIVLKWPKWANLQ